jgi:hypothetical protein
MTIEEYENITGTTVPESREAFVSAQLARAQSILEDMLGFTLDSNLVNENQYDEEGKTRSECPNPEDVDLSQLDPADPVVFAYRLFPYHKDDEYLSIDPATQIHAVKLVNGNVTYRTFDPSEYVVDRKNGLIRFLRKLPKCWYRCDCECNCNALQLAVDADWLWPEEIPLDLQLALADIATYYSNPKKGVKSETLGTHSYSLFSDIDPVTTQGILSVVKKYAGPNGSIERTITV